MSSCSSCGAPITWARTSSGKAIPIDADPRADGNLVLVGAAGTTLTAEPVSLLTPADAPRYVSHFATCPDADRHRALTERQHAALAFVRAHERGVSSDELGAVLHEFRRAGGGRGHDRDERCDYCAGEGADMGGVLRAKGLVDRRRSGEGLVWVPAGSSPGSSEGSQLAADDPFPEGF